MRPLACMRPRIPPEVLRRQQEYRLRLAAQKKMEAKPRLEVMHGKYSRLNPQRNAIKLGFVEKSPKRGKKSKHKHHQQPPKHQDIRRRQMEDYVRYAANQMYDQEQKQHEQVGIGSL